MSIEKIEEENNGEAREVVIPGETIVSGEDYLPGEGTKREGKDIAAQRYGLVEMSGKLVKVIPLSGVYQPRRGNVIIGKVENVTFNGWVIDINTADGAFLSGRIREKKTPAPFHGIPAPLRSALGRGLRLLGEDGSGGGVAA
jgi:exosome complex RNA-binding protein Rrp4